MTRVNWYRQLGLALMLFVLGAVAFWMEYKHKPQQEAAEEKSKKVFQLTDTSVQSVALLDGNKKVVLNCVDFAAKLCKPGDHSKWEMNEPLKAKADDSNANSLLSTLNTLTPSETIPLKEETPEKRASMLKEYGLDQESLKKGKRVDLVTSTGTTILYLGSPHPMGDSLFALKEEVTGTHKPLENVDETKVYLIPNFFKANLERDLTYWRDKKLVALGTHEVESFKLNGSKGSFSANKKNGQWVVHSDKEEISADTDSVDALLSSATFLTAKTFTSNQKNDAAAKEALKGSTPVLTLTLQKEKGSSPQAPEPLVITLYGKKSIQANSKLFATVSTLDPLFEIESSSLSRLDKGMQDLRLAKLITSMDRFGTKRLEFKSESLGPNPLTLISQDGKWVNQADKKEVSQDKVQSLLEKLSGNRIKEFLIGSKIPHGEKNGLTLHLGDESNASKRQLLFWKVGVQLYAKDLQSPRHEAYLIDSSVTDTLPWDQNFFKVSDTQLGTKSDTPKK